MKKLILLCFLGGVCLLGSKLKAQSGVAESPIVGADFLHRSVPQVSPEQGDTHRGGETRSDTLPEDGSLVDHSGTQGQKGEGSSATVGEGSALIYGEIVPLGTHSELTMQLWEDPIDQITHNPSMEYLKIPLQSGTLMTGNPGSYWFRKNFTLEKTAYLSIQAGDVELMRNILVFPEDSIKFRWNQRASELAFAGPASDWFTLQQDLIRLNSSRSMESSTVIHSRNPAGMFQGEKELDAFRASQELEFGRRVDVWKINPAEMLQDLQGIHQSKSPDTEKALDLIRSYSGKIPKDRLDLLEVEELAKSWKHYWVLLQSLQRYSTAEPQVREELIAFFKSSLVDFNPLASYPGRLESPAYLEMNYEKVRLMRALLDMDARDCISSLFEGEEQELMTAKNLFRTFPASGMALEEATALVQSFENGSLRKAVQRFLASFAPNTPISASEFMTTSGESIGLDQFRGKAVLVHFWFTGCKASAGFYSNALRELEESYASAEDVQIISISVDASPKIWAHGLETGLYSSPSWKQLYVGDTGSFHSFLKTYGIYTYPHVLLIDKDGNLVQSGGFERNTAYLKSRIESVR